MSKLPLCLAALALLAAAAPARAADKRVAAAHFQHGRALFEAGSYAEALDEFNAGYAAYPLPGFLVNIGQCQRKLDRLDDAAASFQKFLDADAGDARLRAEVQDALDEVRTERARRQAAAEAEAARRQRDEVAAQQPPVEPAPAQPDLTVHAAPAPVVAASAAATSEPVATVRKPKSHRWVWAVVGVLAAGATAAAVSVAVVETTQSPAPRGGSLGLLDGRR